MASHVCRGAQGRTVGPLKPSGKICLNGETLDACSEGMWIETDTDIVVIDSRSRNLIVRPATEDVLIAETLGEILPVGDFSETTPLHAPPALVERINAIACGAVVGCFVIPLVWLSGTALSISALLVPVAGAAAGFLFERFVKGALDFAGPREDHRPKAFAIAGFVTVGTAIGACIGVNVGFGFLGISCGLILGALLGGLIIWMWIFLSGI
jgi:hypothetical protein